MADSCLVEYPALGRTVIRPTRYRTAPTQAEPIGLAIARLSRFYSDVRISEILLDLSPAAIIALEADHFWNRDAINDSLEPMSGVELSPRQVEYYRSRMGLTGRHRGPRGKESVGVCRHVSNSLRAVEMGWGELCPMTSGELRLVEDLHQRGPGSRRELEWRTWLTLDASKLGGKSPLRRLIDKGAVILERPMPRPIYALAKWVVRRMYSALDRAVKFAAGLGISFHEI